MLIARPAHSPGPAHSAGPAHSPGPAHSAGPAHSPGPATPSSHVPARGARAAAARQPAAHCECRAATLPSRGARRAHGLLSVQLYGGAALATAARLKWDPSTYLALRELFPAEYRVACVVLTAGGATLLALAHLAAAAAHLPRPRRALLLYVVGAACCVLYCLLVLHC
ncbi:hypothetical protein HF086_002681 [Spodoptera exigua]|uniref:Uncharacterized protein n=1 Tax=Spodoptera exigua TaxID=7107 RepID=A0A922ST68_SPOEX|nr:hypothetical protein HF086_002681 [Spodoptera exigua]